MKEYAFGFGYYKKNGLLGNGNPRRVGEELSLGLCAFYRCTEDLMLIHLHFVIIVNHGFNCFLTEFKVFTRSEKP